ncbi:sigma-70 family RNA polymerase sigma factor [Calycomorphotria hydatis]|uniref:RNA polymerase sigma factor n=1 Tax=Calycomorphotria hydatis TaxID=2528027 RepID=A0A517T9U5_9PLAN|nr:sigma-70 family RNA polymerase sigma factor [Calycomorphotria hydatis]QDT65150.1 RNA polymerase sigma factor [Calycomorphotria hydatis]
MLSREQATAILLEERLSLTAFIMTIVRSFHLAEDIFQDACVKTLLREEQFESKDHLLKWTRVLCRNRAIDVIRSRDGKYVGLSEEALGVIAADWNEHEVNGSDEARDALSHCLSDLTSYNRKVLQLRYFEGRSGLEVADMLGKKPATVYQALARIHRMLESCIQTRLALNAGGSP